MRILLLSLAALTALAVPSAHDGPATTRLPHPHDAIGESWTGWRGQSRFGQAQTPGPTSWADGVNIHWRTVIPGDGHSSPIVFGEHVYVSTAFPQPDPIRPAFSLMLLVTSAMLLALAGRRAVQICGAQHSPGVEQIAAASVLCATALLLTLVVLCGEAVFDYARCPVRSWLATAAFVSGCLLVMLFGPADWRFRIALIAAAIAVAVGVFAGVPAKAHSLRGGLRAVNAQVVMAAAALPLLPAIAAAFWLCPGRRRRAMFAIVAAAVILVVSPRFVSRLLVYRESTLPELGTLARAIPTWAALLPVAVLSSAALAWRLSPASRTRIAAFVLSAAIALLWLPIVLLDALAARSPYLAYHIGQPRFELVYPPLLLGAAALAVGWAMRRGRRNPSTMPASGWRSRDSLAGFALALAVLFFVRFNLLPATQQTVHTIVAIDRSSGDMAWIADGLLAASEARDRRNSPATPTPVTDGRHVCAYFGNPGLLCATASGRRLWSRTDVPYESYYGAGFSPLLRDGVLLLANDAPSGHHAVRAFDVASGRSIWTRDYRGYETISGNSRTPILVTQPDGRVAAVLWGRDYLRAVDLRTGVERWHRAVASHGDLVSGLVADDRRLYLSSSGGTMAFDVRTIASRDVGPSWATTKGRSNCATPVLCRDLLITVTDAGVVTALDAGSGETRWQARLEGQFFGSPIAAGGLAYVTNVAGETTVYACEDSLRVVARNGLRGTVIASPAVAGGQFFVRVAAQLIAIGEPRRALLLDSP